MPARKPQKPTPSAASPAAAADGPNPVVPQSPFLPNSPPSPFILNSVEGPAAAADSPKPVVLLSGGNPQIAKADGDAPVQAYIAAMPDWKSDLGRRLDALIVDNAPAVRKAVRWNSPWYGLAGQGWFLSYHVFARYVKVTFLNGAALQPPPPGKGKDPAARWLNIYETGFDAEQMADWIRQAAARPGWPGF